MAQAPAPFAEITVAARGTRAALGAGMHRQWMVMVASGLALALAAGCNSSVETGTGGQGGSGGSGGSGAGGSGGACSAFADSTYDADIPVTFVNQTSQPVFIPSTCTTPSYQITPQGPPDGVSYTFDGSCLQTCEALQTQPGGLECGACPEQTYRIDPGKTLTVTWKGTGLKNDVAMPPACWFPGPGGQHGGTCSQIVKAPAMNYKVEATGFSGCTGPCTCDANGVCQGSATGTQAIATPAFIDLSEIPSGVSVVFETCAFGCPDSP